ncbi:heterokaryon incompatibility protein-domain-containing protein [Boeremia exigua]|uniref:heterokaryon incompatibility protein-domain-containing protein n=1 Tax=Boeremia exigua TaxID=749465 RepID=UPI001E8E27A3|nr:heterokaryon incompatibility protein-domain-containing protein [Boeremia exigua]KAH6637382.1 heterokaryon incompatibility protein-domain-containing protein [Boeremia exigua]
MRLLKLLDEHAFILTEFTGSSLPPYAILSHTWGIGDEEVTYQDMKSGVGRDKVGYSKLTFCAKLARQDGLEYFWVDTCCIDKSSSAELSEAINSMFKWYREAAQCYVYLSDVIADGFTRGWTLQELLAPKSVRFFTTDAECIGTRESLLQPIQIATGIALGALEGQPLDQFSIEARFSWAERRQTTREEDEAYSMLGIFGVFPPQIYGEGRLSALRRLRKEIKSEKTPL